MSNVSLTNELIVEGIRKSGEYFKFEPTPDLMQAVNKEIYSVSEMGNKLDVYMKLNVEFSSLVL